MEWIRRQAAYLHARPHISMESLIIIEKYPIYIYKSECNGLEAVVNVKVNAL